MSDLLAARRRYAEEIRGAADLRSALLVRAFATVPREAFLGAGPWSVWNLERWRYETTPDADPLHVYRDAPIGIVPARLLNNGQPSFVASLIDALDLQPGETVVHVGAGTGYFAAIIAETIGASGRVTAIELDGALASRARHNLRGWPQASVVHANGCEHDAGEVDAMLINAGASAPLPHWIDSLRDGGRLVMPLVRWPGGAEEAAASGNGVVLRVMRENEGFEARVLGPVMVFPCIGGVDPEADRRLADALRRLDEADAVRSLRRDVHDRGAACWLHGEGYCLSCLPAVKERA